MQQQDWDDLKAQMACPWGHMKLKCDQFEVTLAQETDSKSRKWMTSIYVGGVLDGKWCQAENGEPLHEEARRFFRKVERRVYSAKRVEEYRKLFGKREANKLTAERYVYFLPHWSSFNSLKRHLLANNQAIERIH